jgi:hypothetical protein
MTKDEALKKALEAYKYWGGKPLPTLELQATNAIKEALAQPETEPIILKVNGIPPFKNPPGDVIDSAFHVSDWARSNNWVKWRIGDCCSVDFTTTPKREWVGLTEEEKHDCYLRIDIWSRCYEMVEAKLREKNG